MTVFKRQNKPLQYVQNKTSQVKLQNVCDLYSYIASQICFLRNDFFFQRFFLNWHSLRARLNSHYEAWSYKKKKTKRLKYTANLFRRNIATVILDLKPFRSQVKGKHSIRQGIPESICARKEIVNIDILVKSRNGGRKIMQSIYQNNEQTSLEKKEVELVGPVLKNIYQSNTTYRKDLSRPNFGDEPRAQEKQQVKD